MSEFIVTIDGPAGSGKSSVARGVAQKLGFEYLNTGAMYRAIAFELHSKGLSPNDNISRELEQITMDYKDGCLYVSGKKVGDEIRSLEIGSLASDFARVPAVRKALTRIQRAIAKGRSIVVEGRDMGTVVFPTANVKIFLTASLRERVFRRMRELQMKGIFLSYKEIEDEIKQRDRQDSSRPIAPLKPAENSVVIDTTGKSLDEVIDEVSSLVLRRIRSENLHCR